MACPRHVDSGLRRKDGEGRAGNDRAGTARPLWIADQVRNDGLSRHSCSSHGVDYSCGPGWDFSVC